MRSIWITVVVVGLLGGRARAEDTAPAAQAEDPGRGSKIASLVLVGTGVVAWGATFGYGLYARGKYETALDANDPDEALAYKDKLRVYGTSLFIAGTAAFGAAAVVYFMRPRACETRTAVVPMVSGESVGLAFSGGF